MKTGAGGVNAYKPEGIGTPTGERIGRDLIATEPSDAAREAALGGGAQLFQGDTAKMANQVMNLPAEQRVGAIKQIAALYNKKTATNVAKAAGISLKLNPL
jgi:hypothetical protein